MTEESAAARLEAYRNAWRSAPGVVDSGFGFPDMESMEAIWAWSDYVARTCVRNPMLLANISNDLQAYSKGRFILGIGSQIRPHITKRFSMPWADPAIAGRGT